MPSSDDTPSQSTPDAKPPRCAMCRARMTLKSREEIARDAERLVFECPACGFVKAKIVGGPDDSRNRRRGKAPAASSG